jgi:transposase
VEQVTREIVRAKRVIQVHAVDAAGRVVTSRSLSRERFVPWCAQLPAGCLVAMEASSSAHHWCRRLMAMGLDARIISAQLAAPYRQEGRSGKNDANDAAAICEAASRPKMRFAPVKSVDQQSMLCVHKLREGLKEERTACINRIRGLLAEFGLVFAQSPEALRAVLADVLEDASNELGALARLAPQRAAEHWRELDQHLAPALQRRQERAGRHHQARADLPANVADPGREIGGAHCAPARGPDLALGARAARALGVAKGHGGAGQQERADPLGADDAWRSVRRRSHEHEARLMPGPLPCTT